MLFPLSFRLCSVLLALQKRRTKKLFRTNSKPNNASAFIDIANVKAVFKEKLRIMYHTRISYPELNTAPQHDSKPRPRRKRFFKSLQDSGDTR